MRIPICFGLSFGFDVPRQYMEEAHIAYRRSVFEIDDKLPLRKSQLQLTFPRLSNCIPSLNQQAGRGIGRSNLEQFPNTPAIE